MVYMVYIGVHGDRVISQTLPPHACQGYQLVLLYTSLDKPILVKKEVILVY